MFIQRAPVEALLTSAATASDSDDIVLYHWKVVFLNQDYAVCLF